MAFTREFYRCPCAFTWGTTRWNLCREPIGWLVAVYFEAVAHTTWLICSATERVLVETALIDRVISSVAVTWSWIELV